MALTPMICPQCGASIQVNQANDYGYCAYCGVKIQLFSNIKIEHSGTINVDGIDGLSRMLSQADAYRKIGNFRSLFDTSKKIKANYPDCGFGYFYYCCAKSQGFTNYLAISDYEIIENMRVINIVAQIEKKELLSQLDSFLADKYYYECDMISSHFSIFNNNIDAYICDRISCLQSNCSDVKALGYIGMLKDYINDRRHKQIVYKQNDRKKEKNTIFVVDMIMWALNIMCIILFFVSLTQEGIGLFALAIFGGVISFITAVVLLIIHFVKR